MLHSVTLVRTTLVHLVTWFHILKRVYKQPHPNPSTEAWNFALKSGHLQTHGTTCYPTILTWTIFTVCTLMWLSTQHKEINTVAVAFIYWHKYCCMLQTMSHHQAAIQEYVTYYWNVLRMWIHIGDVLNLELSLCFHFLN
jgi:hypothetical protein